MKQRVDRLWVLLLLAAMLLSLARAIVRPKDINYYENRPAAAIPGFTLSGLLAGEDQDALEQALSDQTPRRAAAGAAVSPLDDLDSAVGSARLHASVSGPVCVLSGHGDLR